MKCKTLRELHEQCSKRIHIITQVSATQWLLPDYRDAWKCTSIKHSTHALSAPYETVNILPMYKLEKTARTITVIRCLKVIWAIFLTVKRIKGVWLCRSLLEYLTFHRYPKKCRSYRLENLWKQISLSRRCPHFRVFLGVGYLLSWFYTQND